MGTRDNQLAQREREPYLRALVAECGMSYDDAAPLIGCSVTTVKNDVDAYGGLEAFAPNRPLPSKAFGVAFRKYAAFVTTSPWDRTPLREMIETWLDIPKLHAFLKGAREALLTLLEPSYAPDQKPYVTLLRCVYGPWSFEHNTDPDETVRIVLSEIASGTTIPPAGMDEAKSMFAARLANKVRTQIAPAWPENAAAQIDAVLATLDRRERDFLQRRFGLGREAQTCETMGIPGRRSRDIERRFMRLLHQSDARVKLSSLRRPFQEVVGRDIQDVVTAGTVDMLYARIDTLDLDPRIINLLAHEGVEFVGQIVVKSEREVLKIKYLGPGRLNEIKDVLAEYSLSLGMKHPDFTRSAPARQ